MFVFFCCCVCAGPAARTAAHPRLISPRSLHCAQDGLSSPTAGVRSTSIVALARMLETFAQRQSFRAHGLCQRLCSAAEGVLTAQAPPAGAHGAAAAALYGVHAFHADAALGVLVLVYLAFEDGTAANLDFLASPPLIALSLRLLADAAPAAMRADAALAQALAQAALPRPASSTAPDAGSAVLSNAASVRAPALPLEAQLQPFLQRGSSAGAEGGAGALSRQTPPRALSGHVSALDLALYIPLRCCLSGDLGAEGGASASASASSASEGGAGAAAKGALLVRHATPVIRDALRQSLGGRGLQALALAAAHFSRALQDLASGPPAPAPASASASALPQPPPQDLHPAARAALARGIPATHLLPLSRLSATLSLLNDASFLSEENTAQLAQTVVPQKCLLGEEAGGAAALGGGGGVSLVSVLLSCVSWGVGWLGRREGGGEGSSEDNPAAEAVLGSLRVLVNLTHCYAPGCKALVSARRIAVGGEGEEGSSSSSSSSSSTPSWGVSVVLSVLHFAQGSSSSSSGSAHTAHFDALVLALGCLANCVEKDARVYDLLVGRDLACGSSGEAAGPAQQPHIPLHIPPADAAVLLGGRPTPHSATTAPSPTPATLPPHSTQCPALAYLVWMLAQLLGRMGFSDAGGAGSSSSSSSRRSPRAGVEGEGEGEEGEGEGSGVCDPDDAVLAGYLTLLLGCCLKYEARDKPASAILLWMGRLVRASGGASPVGGGGGAWEARGPMPPALARARVAQSQCHCRHPLASGPVAPAPSTMP